MGLYYRDAEEKVKKSVDRILNIWQERGVYSKNTIDKIKSGTGECKQMGHT